METNNPLIYQKLTAVMAEVESIGKNKKNASQGFTYRGIDDVYNALHGLFAKHQIFVTFEVLESKVDEISNNGKITFATHLKVKYTFFTIDGSSVTTTTFAHALDMSDKGSGKALSYAYKYVLMQMFLIPTEDLADNDKENITVASTTTKPAVDSTKLQAVKTQITQAKTLDELKTIYEENKSYYGLIKDDLSQKRKELTAKNADLPNSVLL